MITASIPVIAADNDDYSYLDDMTINQLKALDEEIHKRIPVPSDDSSSSSMVFIDEYKPEEETENGEEVDFEKPITVIDNEDLKMDFVGKFANKDYIGYKIVVENKSSDDYISVNTTSATMNGSALAFQAGPYTSFMFIAPKSKASGEYSIPLDGRELGMKLETIDDLVDFKATEQIHFSHDGNSTYSDINYTFSCIVP